MQILENQFLYLNNLISYKSQTDKESILGLTDYIYCNLHKLGVNPCGKAIFTIDKDNYVEILFPTDKVIESQREYEFKKEFRLVNAITVRHEGSFRNIGQTLKKLLVYAEKKEYVVITNPYYMIERNIYDAHDDCIIDIYIGIDYNVL